MAIQLDSTKIPGYDQKISATLTLAGEDASGQSSYTTQIETGDKPKALSVSTNIKYDHAADLTRLVNLAEAKNELDERLIYSIINPTAKAMNIRRVHFLGDLTVRENEGVQSWAVSFKLIEFESVAEKKAERVMDKPVLDQAAVDQPIVPDSTEESTADQLSNIETQVLNVVDKILTAP